MKLLLSFLKMPAGERHAAVVIVAVIFVFYIALPAWIRFTAPDLEFSYEVIRTDIPDEDNYTDRLTLHPFDPNTISYEELVEMGLSSRLSRTWVRFRERVSPFKESDDLLRLYGMDSILYHALEPFVEIDPSITGSGHSGGTQGQESSKAHRTPVVRFHFDPNLLPADSLQMLGIPPRVARTISNFRERGGKFHRPDDLLRIFNMPENLYYELEPWVKISAQPESPIKAEPVLAAANASPEARSVPLALSVLDINKASAGDFRKFRGIGEVLSDRIVSYREQLGGFYRTDQIFEVWGIQDSVILNMLPHLEISNKLLSPININTATRDELSAHPYINYQQAGSIVNYRNQNGSFAQVDHLLRIYTLNEDWLARVKPYLVVH